MTIYKQPDAQAFAENAPSSEISTFTAWLRGLGIAFDETNGFPQMEGINDVLNRITQGIKYLEQYGIPLWRSDLEYPVGASVVYNGIQYRCIAQNTNAQPDLSQLSWQSAIVDNLTTASKTQMLSANQGKILADMLFGDISVNGSQSLNGLSIRWGSGRASNKDFVKFKTPFSNELFGVVVTDSNGNNQVGCVRSASNISQFQISTPVNYIDYFYIAFGR